MVRLTHIHIPVDDFKRARRFYQEVFGWKVEDTGSGFQVMRMVPADEEGKGVNVGATYGALYKRLGARDVPSFVIEVPSIDEYVKKVKAAGGKLVTPKNQVGLDEYLAEVTDSEGNLVGLAEPSR